jgi:hypothetical protein
MDAVVEKLMNFVLCFHTLQANTRKESSQELAWLLQNKNQNFGSAAPPYHHNERWDSPSDTQSALRATQFPSPALPHRNAFDQNYILLRIAGYHVGSTGCSL